jgi:hypothetical protein
MGVCIRQYDAQSYEIYNDAFIEKIILHLLAFLKRVKTSMIGGVIYIFLIVI